MKRKLTTRLRQFAAATFALLLVLSVLGPVGTVSAQSVSITQTAPDGSTVAPGSTVTVEATVDYSDLNSPGIDVTLPAGWSVTSHDDDGGSYGPPEPAWVWLEGDADGVSGSHTVTYTVAVPADAAEGDYTLSAEGSGIVPADSSSESATDDLTVTVAEPQQNSPPTADAGSDQTVEEGVQVALDATGSSDPDDDALSYTWTQTSGQDVSLSDTSDAQPTFSAPDVDGETTLAFEVEVADGNGGTDTDSVSVTVQPPDTQPSVSVSQSATPATVAAGGSVTVQTTIDYGDVNAPGIDATLPTGWTVASHADDGGQYGPSEPAWVWPEGDADGVSGTHAVTYTVAVPADAAPGDYTLSAEASAVDPADGSSVSDTVESTVTVEAQNQGPSASFSTTPGAPEVDETVAFDATASSDADGSIASYAWSFGDGATATGATPTHAYDAAGTYTVTLTVTDDEGATAQATTDVVVSEAPNAAPTAAFTTSPSSPAAGETVTLDGSASSDADGSIESYEWSIETPGSTGQQSLLDAGFEGDSLAAAGWTHDATGDAAAGVSDATANSGSQSAFHHGGAGSLVSPELDAGSAQSVTVSYWVQKGAESFSENPDAGEDEDLVVEYLDADGDWVEIDRIEDSVDAGAETSETVTLSDAAALHDGLTLRFRQQGASVASGDYWHVDDVSVTATGGTGGGTVTASGETVTQSFDETGSYEVTLTVTDDDGATDSATQTLDVVADDQAMPVTVAVASLNEDGDDSAIETAEIQQAIDLWAEDDPVPGTDGETLATTELQELIDVWAEDGTVDDGQGVN
jgi:PKD repeat protein